MAHPTPEDPFISDRAAMVLEQIQARGIRDERVLEALRWIPRHRFVPQALWRQAYEDHPLPIGPGQTISQPYIVAAMAEVLELQDSERVLEIGSGCGYAAAVISHLAREVYGIELEPILAFQSQVRMEDLGFKNVHLRQGDGNLGWPEQAPFDAILLSCAATEVPRPLWDQLRPGGRFLYPKGPEGGHQELVLVTKTPQGPKEVRITPVRFVPLRRK